MRDMIAKSMVALGALLFIFGVALIIASIASSITGLWGCDEAGVLCPYEIIMIAFSGGGAILVVIGMGLMPNPIEGGE